ncbi:class I adenylate-forming enzyme family protein [Vulcanisaeta thermophila]|uniref:class I adenylate-forming enzyme family protein n=1 Tax=Vulcanisaeta thermophila TaxID=867917 RepID=UPI000A029CEE|nr:class I adenylate-forming enzyme family protein [Vulcanisaeta thermophila]
MATRLKYPFDNPVEALREYRASSPNRVFLVDDEGRSLTYGDLYEESARLASAMQGLGVGKGDRVGVVMSNGVELVNILFATWTLGATAVVIDPLTISEDLDYQLSDASPKVVFVDPQVMERERGVLSRFNTVVTGSCANCLTYSDLLNRGSVGGLKTEYVNPRDDVGLIYYYAGIASRTEQVWHTFYGLFTGPYAFGEALNLGEDDVVIVTAQLAHILGLTEFLAAFLRGSRVVLVRHFDVKLVPSLVSKYGVTVFAGVPLMFDQLLNNNELDPKTLSTLRIALSAAAPLPPQTQLGFYQRFGVPLVQFYGLTEAFVLTLQPLSYREVTGTVGSPIPDVEVKIVDPRNPGRELGVGEVGELMVKAPWVMKGYSDPEDTRRAFYNGWLLTGDLMVMDERGLLYFRGVKKRMIKYKGYPIFPRDLEVILMKHPAVKEVYVTGEQAENPSIGQIPVAYVVLKEEYRGKVSEGELMDFVNSRVAFYKKLRKVYFVDKLPT